MQYLENESINFADCRGQTYDNASNMSGRYGGMQAYLTNVNPLAFYIPCMAHSLNLVGVCAVDCCKDAVSFFGFVQSLYTFFSASTRRWAILKEKSDTKGLVLKSLNKTKTNLYPQVRMVRGEGGPEMVPKEPLHLMVLV